MKTLRKLRAGDWVEIRSKEEILSSLDKNGRLEGLPFMPQMLQYCGQRFRVVKRAHKTCDTVNGTGGRRLSNAVHLDVRCDGQAFGGCQAECLIFWKEAWLKPLSKSKQRPEFAFRTRNSWCAEEDIYKATRIDDQTSREITYICQATQLPYYTSPLLWRDISQYVEDYTSGNTTLRRMFCSFTFSSFYYFSKSGKTFNRPLRWLYDRLQAMQHGIPYPRKSGQIPADQPTPTCSLNLQPGELVRVKSYNEILATVDANNNNRGLSFDAELVPYCGGTYRVKARVEKFIDEITGKMKSLKTPAVMLDGVWCQSRYSECRLFCPRSIHSWWREIWLERVPENSDH